MIKKKKEKEIIPTITLMNPEDVMFSERADTKRRIPCLSDVQKSKLPGTSGRDKEGKRGWVLECPEPTVWAHTCHPST